MTIWLCNCYFCLRKNKKFLKIINNLKIILNIVKEYFYLLLLQHSLFKILYFSHNRLFVFIYLFCCSSDLVHRNQDCIFSVRIIDLVSHTTYVVCVYFIYKWRELQFQIDSERQIFWEIFHDNFYLLSEFLLEICWEEIAAELLF